MLLAIALVQAACQEEKASVVFRRLVHNYLNRWAMSVFSPKMDRKKGRNPTEKNFGDGEKSLTSGEKNFGQKLANACWVG